MKLEKVFTDETALAARQAKFIDAVEGIGDILVFDTKRKNQNKEVLESLKKLTGLVRDLFSLRDQSPEQFERLVLAQRLFKLFHENPREAELRLAFDPHESLIVFSTALDQIKRVRIAALEARNDGVSRAATYHLNWLLADLAQKKNNGAFMEQILRELHGAMREAVMTDDASACSAAVDWYVDIVFKDAAFQLDYLSLFDRHFAYAIRFVVNGDHRKLFEELVSSLVDGISLSLADGRIWDYGRVIMESNPELYQEIEPKLGIVRRLQELSSSEGAIDTREKLNAWLARFLELKNLLIPYFSPADAEKAATIDKEIAEHVADGYKHKNLVELIFKIGAFCLAEGKLQYIRDLWEYKQPPDSDAHWIGHDVVPGSLKEVLDLYFRQEMRDPEFSLLDGHRSLVPYLGKYFLLVLGRLLQGAETPGTFDFRGWAAPRLSDLARGMRELIPTARALAEAPDNAVALGFDRTKVVEIFGSRLVGLLNSLADRAEERISDIERDRPMAPAKIAEFRNVVFKEYQRVASLRSVYEFYEKIVAHPDDAGEILPWGIKTADAKAGFFDEWYVNYVGWGKNYGQRMAIEEDSDLGLRLAGRCLKIEPDGLDAAVRSAGSNAIILSARRALLSFELGARFDPAWRAKEEEKPKVSGFQGWYISGDQRVPIFEFHSDKAERSVLVVARESLGELHEFSPLDAGDLPEEKAGNVRIKIRAYSQDEYLLNETLSNPPKWVLEIDGDEKRRNYLKKRVLIEIWERFDLRLPGKFLGWTYNMPVKDF